MKVRNKAFSNYLLKEVEDITTSIENACGLNRVHWFAKNSRQRECVVCRAIFSKMMRDKTNISLTEIGSLLDRDHTTVLYSIRNLEMWAEMKGFYKDEAEMLTKSELNYESIHNKESESYVDMNGNTWIKKNMLKVNKKTLEVEHTLNYKAPFYVMLVLNIVAFLYIANKEVEVIRKTRIIHKTDTMIVERKDIALNDSAICAELVRLGCVLPNVAVAQFRIETGNYTSAICRENKNLAGIRNSSSPLSIGKNRGHNAYKTYRDCLKDYVRVQNKYLKNIDGRYAEAKGYVRLIKSMRK